MDQNSNMGGFAPMPGQEGMGGNGTVVTPTGFQDASAAAPAMAGATPMNNTMPNPMAAPAPAMAQQAPAMPGMPAPGMPGVQAPIPASATAGMPCKDVPPPPITPEWRCNAMTASTSSPVNMTSC